MVSMRMGLEMKMSQQLIMTPQLQQAIKLLQLSRVELEELIDQALIENPTLEVTPNEKEEEESETKETEEATADDGANLVDEQSQLTFDDEWQQYVESGAGVIQETRSHSHDGDEESNPLEATISRSTSLADHLLWQLEISKFTELELEIAEYLIGNMDEDGYLSSSQRELLQSNEVLAKLVDQALQEGLIHPLYPAKDEENRFDAKHQTSKKVETKSKRKKAPPTEEEFAEEEDL